MNPSMMPLLVIEMRELGIRSLHIELEPVPTPVYGSERDTMSPPEPMTETDLPPKFEDECAAPGCTSKRGGLFSGIAGNLCREHALQKAGVRT